MEQEQSKHLDESNKKQQEAKQIQELANKMAMLKLQSDQQAQLQAQQKNQEEASRQA